jgi:hypothetical protein
MVLMSFLYSIPFPSPDPDPETALLVTYSIATVVLAPTAAALTTPRLG